VCGALRRTLQSKDWREENRVILSGATPRT